MRPARGIPASVPRRARALIFAFALFCPASAAQADTTASFDVQAEIVSGCAADGVGMTGNAGLMGVLDFGTDSALSTAIRTTSLVGSQAVRLRCTPGVTLSMSIDGGQHEDGGVRHLQSGGGPAERLEYRLYRDPGFAAEIGIGAPQSILVSMGMEDDVPLPVFARLALPGDRPPGVYADTLLVTLSW